MSTSENKEMAALCHQIRELIEQKRVGEMDARMRELDKQREMDNKQREMDNKQREMDRLLIRMEIEKLARTIQVKELETNMELEKAKAEADKKELQAKAEADKKELRAKAEADKKEMQAEADKKEFQAKAEADKKELQAKAEADKKELQAMVNADKKELMMKAEADKREMVMSAELEKLRNEMQQREMRSQIRELELRVGMGALGAGIIPASQFVPAVPQKRLDPALNPTGPLGMKEARVQQTVQQADAVLHQENQQHQHRIQQQQIQQQRMQRPEPEPPLRVAATVPSEAAPPATTVHQHKTQPHKPKPQLLSAKPQPPSHTHASIESSQSRRHCPSASWCFDALLSLAQPHCTRF
jgi:hypothetical protein